MASRSESQESGVNEDLNAENVVKVDEPVGNLSKYYALPPGYSGTPKKGHLMFDACFESGNLGRVDYITEFEYDLFIRPDTCNPRFRVWFNFTVENTAPYQRVIFNIVNFSKTKSLYREGMTPLVKSTSRTKWQRIPAKNCFYYRCPDHRKNYVLSFAFAFDNDTDVYQFAYCFPYTYSRLEHFLDELDKRNLECYKRELLCLTVQQRRVELLTITSTENMKDDLKKRVIFITARIHPGKTLLLLYVMVGKTWLLPILQQKDSYFFRQTLKITCIKVGLRKIESLGEIENKNSTNTCLLLVFLQHCLPFTNLLYTLKCF